MSSKKSRFTFFKNEVPIPASSAAVPEDMFAGNYWDGKLGGSGNILEPPYDFGELEQLVERNSSIQPCIAAYAVNVDGTGYTLEHDGEEVDPKKPLPGANKFFDMFTEISPGKTLLTLRQETRRTLETTGNAFLEVVRNVKEEIIFINLIHTASMRLVKLMEAVTVKRNFQRDGKVIPLTFSIRERAYAQVVGMDTIYFRDFGSSQQIHKTNGEWTQDKLSLNDRGNEIIHLTVNKAANSAYGVPRWINQIPSIVGSREAEEFNAASAGSGGLNAALIILLGGELEPNTRKQIENINAGSAKSKQGMALLEVHGTSGGDIDDTSKNPGVVVEKFGSESSKDAMYEKYGESTRGLIMSSFRLHLLFIGVADSINRATAEVIYALAEAQVFKPERDEFDEIWNMKVMRALDDTLSFKYRSKPIVLKFVTEQLSALGMTKDSGIVDPVSWLTELNAVAGTKLIFREPVVEPETEDDEVEALAEKYEKSLTNGESSTSITDEVEDLSKEDQRKFYKSVARMLFYGAHHDIAGSVELTKCECGSC